MIVFLTKLLVESSSRVFNLHIVIGRALVGPRVREKTFQTASPNGEKKKRKKKKEIRPTLLTAVPVTI